MNGNNNEDAADSVRTTLLDPQIVPKSRRLWRSLYISILFTISTPKKPLSPTSSSSAVDVDGEDSLPSPSSLTKSQLRWRRLYFGISISSFLKKSQETNRSSSSLLDTVKTLLAEQLSRTPSSQSRIAIDIPSEEETEHLLDKSPNPENVVDQIVMEEDLISLLNSGGAQGFASVLNSNLENGICDDVDVRGNFTAKRRSFFYFLLKPFNNYTILLLLILGVLSFGFEAKEKGLEDGWYDGVAIFVTVIVIVVFSSVDDYRSAKEHEKKLLEKRSTEIEVIRNGQQRVISVSQIVKGEIVCLKEGDCVPADGLFIEKGCELVLDEALDSKVDSEKNPFLFSGSKVIDGQGRMLVTTIGANTKLGKLMRLESQKHNKKNLLQARIDKPGEFVDNIALFMCIVIAIVLFVRFIHRKHSKEESVNSDLPDLKGNVSIKKIMEVLEGVLFRPRGPIRVITASLTILVIGLQHGMPCVIALSISYWHDKINRGETKAQNLSACGTMSFVTVLCIDPSGGLISDAVQVDRVYVGDKHIEDGNDSHTSQFVLETMCRGMARSELEPQIRVRESIISWVKSRRSPTMDSLDQSCLILSPMTSKDKKRFGFLIRNNDDVEKTSHLYWNGAATEILRMCSSYYNFEGQCHAMEDQRSKFWEIIKAMEDSGLRTIAVAHKQTECEEIEEDGLNLVALVGYKYSYQEETKSAVKGLMAAGIGIKLVSSDDLPSLSAIAHELGILGPGSDGMALDGEGRELSEVSQRENLGKIELLGNSLPEDTLLMIQGLQKEGEVVAFLGGMTTSDAAILKLADVGICVKPICTELACQSSDVVMSRQLKCLNEFVELGRCMYHNIQIFVQLQLSCSIASLVITSLSTIFFGDSAITVVELIWVNLLVNILGRLMLVIDTLAQDAMTKQRSTRTDSLITMKLRKIIVVQVVYQALVLLNLQKKGHVILGVSKDVMATMIFNTFTLCQVFNLFDAMDLHKKKVYSICKVFVQNYNFVGVLGGLLALQVFVIEFLMPWVGYESLNGKQWGICVVLALLSWGFSWAVKFISLSFKSVAGFPTRWLSLNVHWYMTLVPFFIYISFSYHFSSDIA